MSLLTDLNATVTTTVQAEAGGDVGLRSAAAMLRMRAGEGRAARLGSDFDSK